MPTTQFKQWAIETWAPRLEQGDILQGREWLHRSGGAMCCIGVACSIWPGTMIEPSEDVVFGAEDPDGGHVLTYLYPVDELTKHGVSFVMDDLSGLHNQTSDSSLPRTLALLWDVTPEMSMRVEFRSPLTPAEQEIRDLLAKYDSAMRKFVSLAILNDAGMPFGEIAKIIRHAAGPGNPMVSFVGFHRMGL